MYTEENQHLELYKQLHRFSRNYFLNIFQFMPNKEVHPGQLAFLSILASYDGLSQREIAAKLHIKPPTVAVSRKRLEKTGYVFCKQDPEDHRIVRVYLTQKGLEFQETFMQVVQKNNSMLFQGFSPDELHIFEEYLSRIADNLSSTKGDELC